MKMYHGPFGSYQAGSIGAVLNALCEQEGRSSGLVGNYAIGSGKVYRSPASTNVLATFVWDDEGNVKFTWLPQTA